MFGDASDASDPFLAANGKDSYLYWNVGLALAMDSRRSTSATGTPTSATRNPATGATDFCKGARFQCDERFVFSDQADVLID